MEGLEAATAVQSFFDTEKVVSSVPLESLFALAASV
jgi:hypothetical protein